VSGFRPRPPYGSVPAASGRPPFDKKIVRPTLHPRRVVGGVRLQGRPPALTAGQGAEEVAEAAVGWTWASARWMRPVEQRAPGGQLAEGLEYARAGQTRSIDVKAGVITARVQGRMPQAYKTAVRLPTFTPEQWEKVLGNMASQAKYAAALLAGELPTNIEDLFAPAGLSLFPTDASDLATSCECDAFTGKPREYGPLPPQQSPENAGTSTVAPPPPPPPPPAPKGKGPAQPAGTPLCKHVCCVMYLVADRLAQSPLTVFALRGLPEQDLLERLRQARALQGLQRSGAGAAPVYTPHVPGLPPPGPALEELAASFWTPPDPAALEELDMPIAGPEVSHPLLRRIGPSPFAGAKFPITGLLATCYDVISESVIRESEGGGGAAPG
jgi:uncharacterized Zn finger protein